MILSNVEICEAIQQGIISIDPSPGNDPSASCFNTTAVDLRLGNSIVVPLAEAPVAYDLREPYSASYVARNSRQITIDDDQGYTLKPQKLILAQTLERVSLRIIEGQPCYSARVEGKSSRARIGLVVHLTAPTVHAGFEGRITLEMINLGSTAIVLHPGVSICQLIFETVGRSPVDASNQFSQQATPEGGKLASP